MGRVSLTEDYDDRSVISKLNEMDKRVKENTSVVTSAEASAKASAQSAQETADRFAGSVGAVVQNANAQINASKAQVDQAKAEVDATVTTVAQAVQTANAASESAQQSATTVTGYENRLSTVESDLNAVTLRVTTAEGQIVTIQGRVTELETADGQNVKINRINEYAVGLTGNQPNIAGNKGFAGIVNINFLRTAGADGYRRINIDRSDDEMGVAPAASVLYPQFAWNDKNNNMMSAIYVTHLPDGTTSISTQTRNSDGSIKYTTIAKGDVI